MNILCRLLCPKQFQLKLLQTIKTDLELAQNSLERELPDVTNAKHYLRLASIVINILLEKRN